MTKRVAVSLADDDAVILKEYAAFFGVTQSDVIAEITKAALNNHALNCKKVSSMLEMRDRALDKRAGKPCYTGYGCFGCKHRTACTTGVYQGLFEPHVRNLHLLKEDAPIRTLLKMFEVQKATKDA